MNFIREERLYVPFTSIDFGNKELSGILHYIPRPIITVYRYPQTFALYCNINLSMEAALSILWYRSAASEAQVTQCRSSHKACTYCYYRSTTGMVAHIILHTILIYHNYLRYIRLCLQGTPHLQRPSPVLSPVDLPTLFIVNYGRHSDDRPLQWLL